MAEEAEECESGMKQSRQSEVHASLTVRKGRRKIESVLETAVEDGAVHAPRCVRGFPMAIIPWTKGPAG